MACTLVTYSAVAISAGIGPKGLPVKSRHDYPHPAVGQLPADLHQSLVEELRLVDAHDIDVRGHQQDILCRIYRRGADRAGVVRNDLLFGVSHVDAGFEDFDPQAGEFGPLQAADQLLGFTREHRAAYHFDPTFLAGIFQKHIITALLRFLIPGIGRSLLFDPGDPGSEGVEASVDVLVTAVDLFDVLDRARTFGAHRRDQQRHTRTYVG